MKPHQGKNEGIRALEEIVCQAIPDPSLKSTKNDDQQTDHENKDSRSKPENPTGSEEKN